MRHGHGHLVGDEWNMQLKIQVELPCCHCCRNQVCVCARARLSELACLLPAGIRAYYSGPGRPGGDDGAWCPESLKSESVMVEVPLFGNGKT
jgi:hypothetical protein